MGLIDTPTDHRKPAGAVVRVQSETSGQVVFTERFPQRCGGDSWQAAWAAAARLRREWPLHVVSVEPFYD